MSGAAEPERIYVGALYPGRKWKKTVAKMSDAQVLAIYMREKRKPTKPKAKKRNPNADNSNDAF